MGCCFVPMGEDLMLSRETLGQYRRMTPGERLKLTMQWPPPNPQ
ncbi:MAG: hypothetical protein ABSG86_30505 [Thermoguttaceae bacterium]|jgi:hypothetical protein